MRDFKTVDILTSIQDNANAKLKYNIFTINKQLVITADYYA